MCLLLYISLGYIAIALSLWALAISWAENKKDEAHNLLMQVHPPTELIGMRGRCVAVHWHIAIRYYRYKRSVYERMRKKIMYHSVASSLIGLLCAIIA